MVLPARDAVKELTRVMTRQIEPINAEPDEAVSVHGLIARFVQIAACDSNWTRNRVSAPESI